MQHRKQLTIEAEIGTRTNQGNRAHKNVPSLESPPKWLEHVEVEVNTCWFEGKWKID